MSLVQNHRSWLLFLPITLWIVAYFAWGDTLSGRVVGVADGDTVTVLDADHQQYKIRLSGIDAPEKAQAFGQRSKESMPALIFGKDVDVQSILAIKHSIIWACKHEIDAVFAAAFEVWLKASYSRPAFPEHTDRDLPRSAPRPPVPLLSRPHRQPPRPCRPVTPVPAC